MFPEFQPHWIIFSGFIPEVSPLSGRNLKLSTCSLFAAEQMFWEVMQLRREMSFAKLGYYKDQLWGDARPRPPITAESDRAPPTRIWFPSSCVSAILSAEGKTACLWENDGLDWKRGSSVRRWCLGMFFRFSKISSSFSELHYVTLKPTSFYTH